MSDFAQVGDVKSRVGGRAIDDNADPSKTDVQKMLNGAEAELDGCLEAAGIPSGIDDYPADTKGFLIIQKWVAEYVAGIVRESHAAAGGEGTNDDGNLQVLRWESRLTAITQDPDRYSAMLSTSGSATEGTIQLASHVTDDTLALRREQYDSHWKDWRDRY